MKKTTTLHIPGPFQIEFEYKISFDGKARSGSHREMVLGMTKEQLTEERLQQEINNCLPKIFSKIQSEEPDFFPDGEASLKFDAFNVKTGFYHTDVKVDF
ncbi:hypothetical protein N7605_04775 [Pantoea ananatis]|uniref:hypothetical protein n=1 Tax=Pantoea ananas TaxID=553 RepID=UPI00287D6FED|nr:hypothetical protein [Pantoea ananatis]MDS7719148.1 hypothetical protein [Pantoea ananatis]